ncbi:MAG: alpha/beta hydrolase, partial [Anaerolineales bacterium]
LENVFFALVEKLNTEPARLPITDFETGENYDAVLDGDTLINLLFQFLYASEAIPGLPKMIYDLRDTGSSELLRVLWPLLAFDRTFAGGMYNTTFCAEDAGFTTADLPLAEVRPEIARVTDSSAKYFAELCADWDVPALPASIDDPVVSDIPTLVMNGRFDPITPPAFGEAAARTLSNSVVVTLPTAGHGGALSGECPADIIYDFLDNPNAPPDTSCLDQKPNVEFYTPRSMILTPVAWRWLTNPGPLDFVVWGLLALSTLFLLTPIVVYPLSFLIRLLSKNEKPPQPVRERFGRWAARLIALLAGVLALSFIVGVVAVAFNGILNDQFVILHGFPQTAAPLFAIPPVLIGLALVMVICAVLSWRDAGWGVPGRLYYAALTLTAIAYLAALAPLGWLWVWA